MYPYNYRYDILFSQHEGIGPKNRSVYHSEAILFNYCMLVVWRFKKSRDIINYIRPWSDDDVCFDTQLCRRMKNGSIGVA